MGRKANDNSTINSIEPSKITIVGQPNPPTSRRKDELEIFFPGIYRRNIRLEIGFPTLFYCLLST